MFALTLLFLALLAGLIISLIDIPRVAELSSAESAAQLTASSGNPVRLLLYTLFLIWPIYWIEFAFRLRSRQQVSDGSLRIFSWRELAVCIVPPLRLGLVIREMGQRLWLPSLGWQQPGQELSQQLEAAVSKPMLIIAFLILPVLLLEYAFSRFLEQHGWLLLAVHICTGFIWWCFTCEFIVMVSCTDKKLKYIKKNWLDLAIILLPLISFLRSIRVLRLTKLARVQQLTKMTRMYRMRGLFYKVLRGLMLMKLINRILRVSPQKTLEKLREQHSDKASELVKLEEKIRQMEQSIS